MGTEVDDVVVLWVRSLAESRCGGGGRSNSDWAQALELEMEHRPLLSLRLVGNSHRHSVLGRDLGAGGASGCSVVVDAMMWRRKDFCHPPIHALLPSTVAPKMEFTHLRLACVNQMALLDAAQP